MENTNRTPSFDTLTESLAWLREQGYSRDFNIMGGCIVTCDLEQRSFSPEEFQIDFFFRFEGDSNPADEDIVYAISAPRYDIKGVLTSAFGAYADEEANKMIAKLNVRH